MTVDPDTVAGLWRRVLAAGRRRDDDFFALECDESQALRLAREIRAEYGVVVPLAELFERPTPAQLAALIAAADGKGPGSAVATLSPSSSDSPYPLAPAQWASWLGRLPGFELGDVGHFTYLEIDVDDLDLDRYVEAWGSLVATHDALRTVVTDDGRQHVLPVTATDVAAAVVVQDLRAAPDRSAQLSAAREHTLRQRFDPTRWPLFEIRATRLDDRRTRLHVKLDGLIADPTSVDLLGRDLAHRYTAESPPTTPLPFPPADFSAAGFPPAVRRDASGRPAEAVDRAWRYWRERIADLPPAPQPPTAADPHTLAQPRVVRRSAHLSATRWRRLRAGSAAHRVTPEVALLAAFAEALAGWCKEPRFTVATLRDGRQDAPGGLAGTVGELTQVTVTGIDADPRLSLRERAAVLQRQVWADLDHRDVEGVAVLDELGRATGQPTAAATPVSYSCRLAEPGPRGGVNPWTLGRGEIGFAVRHRPQTWLHHDVSVDADGALTLTYDSVDALLPPALVDDMFAYHTTLVARLADDAEAWGDTGRECLPPRQATVRARVNDTDAPLPDVLLHEPFWAQSRRTPDAPAVFAADRTLTYRQVRTAAGSLADRLTALGIRPNQLVAVVMDKGWEHPVSVLGILASGAAYVPVEPDLPKERFEYLLKHSQVHVALTQPHLIDRLPWPPSVQPIAVDDASLAGPDQPERTRVQSQRDLAYIIYTSGSTGLPKGVMIDHRGALNTVLDINRRFAVGPADRMLALTPLSFDLSVYDLFGPFAVGGALVMPEAGSGRAPWHWADLLERHDVTLWNTVPALMEMLVGYLQGRRQRLPDALRLVLLSGDWIPVSLPDRIRASAAPGTEVVSLGGATEGSIWSVYHRIGEVQPSWLSIPYGTPLTNQHCEILDAGLRRRPDWVPGEQYIGGYGVAMGYWHDEAKTNRSFVVHPRSGRRLYRTGDLGRYHPDGSIEFLGREDFQIKIHGYRIELGEIEAALLAHEAVGSAVVVAVGAARGEKRLVGYVTPDEPDAAGTTVEDREALAASLRTHLAAKLPSYMVPAHIMVLDALPLTRNGKLDRKALPMPTARTTGRDGAAPVTEPTDRLLSIWRDVLDNDRLGVDDDLFTTGAGRADVVAAYRRVHSGLTTGLSLADMFHYRTVRALGDALAEHQTTADLR